MTEENPENSINKKKSRKKRKNFLINAKKYAKKGQMGRGTKIPDELYHYFVGILDSMKKGIVDEDERQALVTNVLERTKECELDIIGNQLGCRVVEVLLPYSSPEDFERFMEIIMPDLRKLCSDNFTSHVVEALLRISCERAIEDLQNTDENASSDTEDETPKKKIKLENKTESKYTKEHIQTCYNFTIKISKYTLNNLEDFVWDQYANHILRSVLKCLSGITLLPGEKPKINMFKEPLHVKKGIPPNETKMIYKNIPNEFKDIVKDFANRLSSWPQFKDLPYENLTSGLLQVLLYAVKNVDKNITKTLIKKLLDESFAPDDYVPNGDDDKKDIKEDKVDVDEGDGPETMVKGSLPPVFESEAAVRLLEAVLFVSKKKTYTQVYARCFINRLARLASLPMLNYTVQRLIDNCQIKEEFEPIFDELSDQLSAILSAGNSGVLVALAKACLRVKAKQTHFIQKLEAALNVPTDSIYFPVCVLRVTSLDKLDVTSLDKEYFINVHGSVILQTILDFERPGRAVSSLLALSPEQLAVIFCDAKGSHVADALCKGRCVGVKARDKLVWKMKGFYQKMALSQHGSRALESIFGVANNDQKIKIMSELSEKSNLLNSTQYGRLIASKLDVAGFKLSQKKWEQSVLKCNKNKNNKDD